MVKYIQKLRLRPMWALENVVFEIIIPHGFGKTILAAMIFLLNL